MRRLSRTLAPLLQDSSQHHIHHLLLFPTAELNLKINECIKQGNINGARMLFDEHPYSRNLVSWNSLINGCLKSRQMPHAQNLFDQMPHKDVVSWNTMLSGFRDTHDPDKAHKLFLNMIRQGPSPNELTFAVLISTFLNSDFDLLIPQLHCLVIRRGLDLNIYLGSALMRGYIGLGDRNGFVRVFDEIMVKDAAPWNVLVLGHMEFGMVAAAKAAFDVMPNKNAFSWSILINGYMKNGLVDEARTVFDRLEEKDVVSWTAMMRGCVQSERFLEALDLFVLMMKSGTRPNHFTFSCVLDACAGCSSLVMGNQVHSCILKDGVPLDVVLATSLVDMYGKCGDVDAAFSVFQSMSSRNLVSWNSIIGLNARHGRAERALEEFDRMVNCGFRPDEISFINVLSACVHGGLVKEGEELFKCMVTDYGIQAEMEHYACMVDLYGRAGELEKAENLIKGMPFEADVVVWGALLGACGLHSCLEHGETAAIRIWELERDHPAVYAMLSRIYGENRNLTDGLIPLGKTMRVKCGRKQKAASWMESLPHVL